MRRNKKFYRDKELLRLSREENKFHRGWRKEKLDKVKTDTGWRKDVSKRLCPAPLYKDLKAVVDMMAVVEREVNEIRKEYAWMLNRYDYQDFDSKFYRVDPMLRNITIEQRNKLGQGSRVLLRETEYSYTNRRDGKQVTTKRYVLKEKYFNYLYTRKAPIYGYSYRWCSWRNTDPDQSFLEDKIERNYLRPKICKAMSRSYNYHCDYDIEYKNQKKKREAEEQLRQDISEAIEDVHSEIIWEQAMKIRELYGHERMIEWLLNGYKHSLE